MFQKRAFPDPFSHTDHNTLRRVGWTSPVSGG